MLDGFQQLTLHCLLNPQPLSICRSAAEAKRRTALHLAAQQGQLEIAKQVINTRRWAQARRSQAVAMPWRRRACCHAEAEPSV